MTIKSSFPDPDMKTRPLGLREALQGTWAKETPEAVENAYRHQNAWKSPPQTVKPQWREPDLTGRQFGRYTVMGRLPKKVHWSKFHRAPWLCRCVCGTYELRRAEAVTNPKNTDDKCSECRHLEDIQHDMKTRTDRWREERKSRAP